MTLFVFRTLSCLIAVAILCLGACQARQQSTQANGLAPVQPQIQQKVGKQDDSLQAIDRIMNQLSESARTCRDIQIEAAEGWDRIDAKAYRRYHSALLLERASCIELSELLEQDPSVVDEACRLFNDRVERLDGEQARTFVALDDPDRLLRNAFGSEKAMLDYFNEQAPLLDSTDIYITCIKLGLAGVQVPPVEPLD